MKAPSLLLQCKSPVIAKTLSSYLEEDFLITDNASDPTLKAVILDSLPSSFIKEFHEQYPQVLIYLLLSPQTKMPSFSFPLRVLEHPVSLHVLKSQLSEPIVQSILTLNEFKLYLHNRRLVHPDTTKNCILTEKETEILAYLHKVYPTSVSREVLLKDVWNYTEGVTTHTLETHIYKLKQKLTLTSGENLLKATEEGYSLSL